MVEAEEEEEEKEGHPHLRGLDSMHKAAEPRKYWDNKLPIGVILGESWDNGR